MNVTACLFCLAEGRVRIAPYVSRIRGAKVAACGEHKGRVVGKTAAEILPVEAAANQTVTALWEAAR